MCSSDLATARCLPDLTVISPADYTEAKKATLAIAQYNGPVYLRLARQNSSIITKNSDRFIIGKANILMSGSDITIIGTGPILAETLLAAKELAKKNIKAEVINCHTIKPLDKNTILKSLQKTRCLVTVEDHQVAGGLGSAIAELLVENYPAPVEMVGVRDTFGESGQVEELWNKYKLSHPYIMEAALKVLKRKK